MQSPVKIIFLLLTSLHCLQAVSQHNIVLKKDIKQQRIEIDLYNIDGGGRLTKLPLFFHLTDKDVLILFLGNDNELENNSAVWLFSDQQELSAFTKEHPLIKVDNNFKRRNLSLNPFFKSEANISLYKGLADGFIIVRHVATPVFIKIPKNSKSFNMDLQFYVSNKSKQTDVLIAKCTPVKIQLNLE